MDQNHPPQETPPTTCMTSFDPSEYQVFLEGTDMKHYQQIAFLEALWSIMTQLVGLGFGLDPVQTLLDAHTEGQDRKAKECD